MIPPGEHRERLTVTVLGGFGLRFGGRALLAIPRKGRALLAYMAVQGWPTMQRDAVADLLWSDRGAEQARHSLRQLLLVLRRELGDVLISAESGVSFDREMVSSDIERWQALAVSDARADLAEAVGLYSGSLLAGFPAVSRDFDDWLMRRSEEMAQAALASLGRLVQACAADGDHAAAVSAAERMVAIDPLREDSHRTLIAAYARAGRRPDALRQYATCVEVLRRELEVRPSAETEALIARVRAGPDTAPTTVIATIPAQVSNGPPWVAVLPFRSIGPQTQPSYFASGLVEDIVCVLAKIREPIVVSSNATQRFVSEQTDFREVASQLNVRYVVGGSVRQNGQWLRISTELTEAASGRVLWAHGYEFRGEELFAIQDTVAARIVHALVPAIDRSELERIRRKHPSSLTSYDLILRARYLMYRLDRASFEEAGHFIQQAIELDPNYSVAHALLADWLNLRIGQGWSNDTAVDSRNLVQAAEAAIGHDRHDARAVSIHAHNRSFLYRDYDTAVGLFEQALDTAPNDATPWMWSASTFAYVGLGAEAVQRAEQARRLAPTDPLIFRTHSTLCLSHYTAGSFEEAAHWGLLAANEAPNYTSNLRFTIAALVALGRMEEAAELAQQVRTVEPNFRVSSVLERHPYRDLADRRDIASRLLQAGLPE